MIIKFNLLSIEDTLSIESKKIGTLFIKIYFIMILFVIFILSIFIYNTQSTLSSLELDKRKKEEALKKDKDIAQKVKAMEKENEEIKRKIEIILTLKEEQDKNLKLMANLFLHVEANRLLFNKFKLDSSKAHIKGMCLDIDFLAIYLQNLENKKELFKAINLRTVQQKTIGEIKLVEFDLEVNF